jgi:hypothetical protein
MTDYIEVKAEQQLNSDVDGAVKYMSASVVMRELMVAGMQGTKTEGLAVMANRQSLRLTFRLSGLITNPLESPCGNQAHNQ